VNTVCTGEGGISETYQNVNITFRRSPDIAHC